MDIFNYLQSINDAEHAWMGLVLYALVVLPIGCYYTYKGWKLRNDET